jgi:hypothetical protein
MADSALLLSSTVSITLAQTSAPVCPDQCKTKRRMIENCFIALYATPHFVASPHLFMAVCMQAWVERSRPAERSRVEMEDEGGGESQETVS